MPYHATGFHTCRNEGGITYLKQNAPFEAVSDTFLSTGFYFWEHRLDDAHYWGNFQRSRFPKGYAICRCELTLKKLLDLCHPAGLDKLAELEEEMFDCGRIDDNLSVSELLQFLRDLDDPDVFDYDSARAEDEPNYRDAIQRPYNDTRPAKKLTFNKRFIICVFTEHQAAITSCRFVYPEQYRLSAR